MNQPNIVLILSDQHNSSVLAYKGDQYIRTPNLDRLAANGVSFNQCYCASPLCVPSRMAFLTGQLPFKTNVFTNLQSLHSDRATIAHTITNAGYETVLAGRMHFTGDDQHHGFEKRLVGDVTPYYQGYDFMEDSFESMYDAFLPGVQGLKKSGAGMSSIYHYDNEVVKETKAFLKDREVDRPLFLTVGLSAPHPPFVAEKEAYDYYYERLPEAENSEKFDENKHQALKDYVQCRKINLIEKDDFKRIRAAYYGLVDFMDQNVGKILEAVEATVGLENTVVIYASDHGEQMGNNGMVWKGTFLDSSAKVPLIIAYPKAFLSNQSVEDPTSLLDLSKTILTLASAESLPDMDGSDLSDYLSVKDYNVEHKTVIGQIGTYPKMFVPMAMVRRDQYKLIKYHSYDTPSLFDLAQDPNEESDLGGYPNYQDIVRDLSAILNEQWDSQSVDDYCKSMDGHYSIINQWSHKTRYEKKVNWKTSPGSNFVE